MTNATEPPSSAENDDGLTEDDKAIARFQQQRLKQARNSALSLLQTTHTLP